MAEFSLERGEKMVISSHVQFLKLKFTSQLKTGDAFLTSRRFVFKGRLQARSLFHLAAVVAGRGKRHFEIPTSALIKAKKRRLENSIEVFYKEGSKEKKFLLKPEKIRHLGTILELGFGVAGGEIGQMLGDSLAEKTGEIVGDEVGGRIGDDAGRVIGEKMEGTRAKSLVKAWVEAFEYVIQLGRNHEETITGDSSPGDIVIEPGSDVNQEFQIIEEIPYSERDFARVDESITPEETNQEFQIIEEIPYSERGSIEDDDENDFC